MNLNKVFILGRLTADPQLRTTTGGQPVATFSLATDRVWKDRNGANQREAEFHNIVSWGRQAEVASQYLKKGALCLVEGRIQTRSWQDKQGQNRKTTEIICERLQLGPRPGGSGAPSGGNAAPSGSAAKSGDSAFDFPGDDASGDIPVISIDDEEIKPEDLPF